MGERSRKQWKERKRKGRVECHELLSLNMARGLSH